MRKAIVPVCIIFIVLVIVIVKSSSYKTKELRLATASHQQRTSMDNNEGSVDGDNVITIIGSPDSKYIPLVGDSCLGKLTMLRSEQILRRISYTTSYNKDTKCPNWVAWHLTAEHTDGEFPRSGIPYFENGEACGIGKVNQAILKGDYFVDMEVEAPRQEHEDWAERPAEMSHGHICPAGDNKWSKAAMNQSFLLTNMCPQDEKLNMGGWKKLEDKCRDWANQYGDIYIVAGPLFYEGARRKSFGKNKIGIPDAFFKVVLCVNGAPKAIGFIYQNNSSSQSMKDCAHSVDEVEEIAGMDFFSSLPDSIEDEVEAKADLSVW